MVESESESESELFLLPSKFTPKRNLLWHIGADNKHNYVREKSSEMNCEVLKQAA